MLAIGYNTRKSILLSTRDVAMTDRPAMPSFNEQYSGLVREAFRVYAASARAEGEDLAERARADAERGKPDLALAALCEAAMPDDEKREVLAHAFERRAELMEAAAVAMEAEHSRPFPLIAIEARKDRTMARQVRAGKMIRPYARAPRMLGMQ
jgi:hypothetical protein